MLVMGSSDGLLEWDIRASGRAGVEIRMETLLISRLGDIIILIFSKIDDDALILTIRFD